MLARHADFFTYICAPLSHTLLGESADHLCKNSARNAVGETFCTLYTREIHSTSVKFACFIARLHCPVSTIHN